MLEQFYDVLHVRLNMLTWSTEPVEVDIREVITKAIAALPGNEPTVPLT